MALYGMIPFSIQLDAARNTVFSGSGTAGVYFEYQSFITIMNWIVSDILGSAHREIWQGTTWWNELWMESWDWVCWLVSVAFLIKSIPVNNSSKKRIVILHSNHVIIRLFSSYPATCVIGENRWLPIPGRLEICFALFIDILCAIMKYFTVELHADTVIQL